jgi:hypothetical protein
MVQYRFLDFLERIHRPFLYLALHLPESSPVLQLIGPHVERCLDACLKDAAKSGHRHRHHRTWYQKRLIFTQCLLLLVAVKSRRIDVPADWRDAVCTTISGLRFWQREAPDLGKAGEILEKLLHEVDQSHETLSQ